MDDQRMSREFHMENGGKTMKHLRFSTRSFVFKKDKYIIMILDDVTELICISEKLKEAKKQIEQLKSTN